jgi:putative flippase GtrA
MAVAFARFAGSNGLVSLIGTAVLVPMLMATAGVSAVGANLVAIVICGVANFSLAHSAVFASRG